MATTKIWPIRDSLHRVLDYAANPEKTVLDSDLKRVLHYAARSSKVTDEKRCFVSGINCRPETAFEQMQAVKEQFGKLGGNQAYHGYQSFKPGEVTPEQCHEIGVRLAQKLWGDRYQVLVATHLDRDHLHTHFCLNSVSFVDGKKFNDNKGEYFRIRAASDEICSEYGLSVVQKPKGHTPRTVYFDEKAGKPTRYNLMREAIDRALEVSGTWSMFTEALYKLGYVIEHTDRMYPTIRSVWSEKGTRLYRLGENYELERLQYDAFHSFANWYDWAALVKPQKYGGAPLRCPSYDRDYVERMLRRAKPLEAVFILFGYLIGIILNEQHEHRKPISPEMREECRKLERYSRQVELIAREHFGTAEDVEAFRKATRQQINDLCRERRKHYDKITRSDDPAEQERQRQLAGQYTERIKTLRRELQTAGNILKDTEKVKDTVRAELDFDNFQMELEAPKQSKNRGWAR